MAGEAMQWVVAEEPQVGDYVFNFVEIRDKELVMRGGVQLEQVAFPDFPQRSHELSCVCG